VNDVDAGGQALFNQRVGDLGGFGRVPAGNEDDQIVGHIVRFKKASGFKKASDFRLQEPEA
jgi:hypothetical protein